MSKLFYFIVPRTKGDKTSHSIVTVTLSQRPIPRKNVLFQRRKQGNRKIVAPSVSVTHIDSFSESRVGVDPPTNTSTPNKPELSSHDSNIVPIQNDIQYHHSQQIVPVVGDRQGFTYRTAEFQFKSDQKINNVHQQYTDQQYSVVVTQNQCFIFC